MSSRRVQAWVWWLLPLLVARALMPVGFMAQLLDGKVQIVLCSGTQLTAKLATHDAGAQQAQHQQTQQDSHNDFSCPFAQLAAAPLLDVSGSDAIALVASGEADAVYESPYYAVGPPRADLARGPPSV